MNVDDTSRVRLDHHPSVSAPSHLAELTGESHQLISQRFPALVVAGYVKKIRTGLYELADEPDPDVG